LAPQIQSLREFAAYYQKTLEALGKTQEDSSFVVGGDELNEMKQQLARLIDIEPATATFLTNSRTQSGWFGHCFLVLDKKEERLFIVSSEGESQKFSLKDKIFGGMYQSPQGESVFISAFYGDLQKKVPYRLFWGAKELNLIQFSIDRTREGTVEGVAKAPDGNRLNIFRKGRDNKTVQINSQLITPVFE
jgi:hypothetical protein